MGKKTWKRWGKLAICPKESTGAATTSRLWVGAGRCYGAERRRCEGRAAAGGGGAAWTIGGGRQLLECSTARIDAGCTVLALSSKKEMGRPSGLNTV